MWLAAYIDSKEKIIRVWNSENKAQEVILKDHTGSLESLAITKDKKYVVSCNGDKIVRVWKIKKRIREAMQKNNWNKVIN
jgi:WD40 repeat protein